MENSVLTMPPCLWTNQIFHCQGCSEFEHVDYKRDCSHLFSFHFLLRMFVYNGLVCDIFAFFVIKSRHPYWEFEIQGQGVPRCPQYEIEDKNTSCIFYFSICKEVPEYCPAGSGICLANKVSPNNTNIILYTRFINIGTTSDDFKSGRTQTQLNLL